MDRRLKEKKRSWEMAQDFSALNLTPDSLHAFYIKFINLRFPMKVEHLLELRYLINHSVDKYKEPPLTPDYRQFRESLQTAVDSFIDNQRYSERMLKILSMLRDIHYTHSIRSRNEEARLRKALAANRKEHVRAVRYGLFFILVTVSFVIIWLRHYMALHGERASGHETPARGLQLPCLESFSQTSRAGPGAGETDARTQ